jgi:hypothetical protein
VDLYIHSLIRLDGVVKNGDNFTFFYRKVQAVFLDLSSGLEVRRMQQVEWGTVVKSSLWEIG